MEIYANILVISYFLHIHDLHWVQATLGPVATGLSQGVHWGGGYITEVKRENHCDEVLVDGLV